jgi:hypothetical protein
MPDRRRFNAASGTGPDIRQSVDTEAKREREWLDAYLSHHCILTHDNVPRDCGGHSATSICGSEVEHLHHHVAFLSR